MIRCHVMEANSGLAQFKDRLEAVTASTVETVTRFLPIDDVDIVFYINPPFTIPEVGVCGYAPTAKIVFMSLDPQNKAFLAAFDEEIPATLAHELHHCMRWRGPGYGKTLVEALVTEGLARDFERVLRGGRLPSYHKVFPKAQMEELLARASAEFNNPSYSHSDWFFGSEARSIPEVAGYSMGYEFVQRHILRSGRSSAELWNEPASFFIG